MDVTIGSSSVKSFLDTGSSVSLVTNKIVKQCGQEVDCTYFRDLYRLQGMSFKLTEE